MKICLVAGLLSLLRCLDASANHPVENVVNLLKNLMAKAEQEGRDEEVMYTKFEYWCANSLKTLDAKIAEEKEGMEELKSVAASHKLSISLLEKQIKELDEELVKMQTRSDDAGKIRTDQNKAYDLASDDIKSTIKAIGEAIEALEKAKSSAGGLLLSQQRVATALALGTTLATKEQRIALSAFAGNVMAGEPERPELKANGSYEKHIDKHSFKSGSVVEMLKALKLKFEDELVAANTAETNSANAHELATAALKTQVKKTETAKETKTTELSDAKGDLAKAKGDFENLRADLKADSDLKSGTHKTCTVKKSEWEERSETRKLEIEAMQAAIGILAKTTGVRTEAPSNPVLPPSPVEAGEALLQGADNPKLRAVRLLRASAKATQSHALERLAQQISAHLSGPFDEVNNMIQKMIFRLMAEQTQEDEHKNWCDQELSKTDTSIKDTEDKLEMIKAKIEEAQASVQQITKEIQEADEMISEIVEHQEEATEIRETGKTENALAIEDAREAQKAIVKAIAVLEAFYKETGMVKKEPYELVQRGVTLPDEPSTWESSYTGVADPKLQPDGIITVLEKISSDFSKMEAETTAQEQSDQKLFEETMQETSIEKARRTKESEMKTLEKKRLVEKIASLAGKEKHETKEHAAVTQYLADLQHACVDGDSTYEKRKDARSKEIAALKEAQTILSDSYNKKFKDPAKDSAESFLRRRH